MIRKKRLSISEMKTAHNVADLRAKTQDEHLGYLETMFCNKLFKILLVGSEDFTFYIKKSIEKNTLFRNLTIAKTIEEAKELCEKFDYKLVLSSFRMPLCKLNGLDLHQALGKDKMFCVIGGYYNQDYERKFLKENGVLSISSPIDEDRLNQLLNTFYLKFLEKEMNHV
jgi:chloramphenicol O-acetyltransferase